MKPTVEWAFVPAKPRLVSALVPTKQIAAALLLLAVSAAAQPIPVGYFGPADPQHPQGGTMWTGAQRAVKEANAEINRRGEANEDAGRVVGDHAVDTGSCSNGTGARPRVRKT